MIRQQFVQTEKKSKPIIPIGSQLQEPHSFRRVANEVDSKKVFEARDDLEGLSTFERILKMQRFES